MFLIEFGISEERGNMKRYPLDNQRSTLVEHLDQNHYIFPLLTFFVVVLQIYTDQLMQREVVK